MSKWKKDPLGRNLMVKEKGGQTIYRSLSVEKSLSGIKRNSAYAYLRVSTNKKGGEDE
tara:strand:- start:128 stop:301 length:174 start_codon:yes stop_codon:yes gene_type:complete